MEIAMQLFYLTIIQILKKNQRLTKYSPISTGITYKHKTQTHNTACEILRFLASGIETNLLS